MLAPLALPLPLARRGVTVAAYSRWIWEMSWEIVRSLTLSSGRLRVKKHATDCWGSIDVARLHLTIP